MAGNNPYAQYAAPTGNPYAVYSIPAQAPKPATGFATAGTPAASVAQTYIRGGSEDPSVIAAQAAARASAAAAASTPIEVSGQIAAARARAGIDLAADRQKMDYKAAIDAQQRQQGPGLTAEERAKGIAGYKAADGLDRAIADMKRLYAEGPGGTSGFAGLTDYLPTTANQRFNAAGNAARGFVGQALGFTGGQLNTEREAAAAVGPYLPQAGDRDEVILDKIARLKGLRDDARGRAVAQLGGVPDQQGRITPVAAGSAAGSGGSPPAAPPSSPLLGGTPASPAPNDPTTVATGATRNERIRTPALNAVSRLASSGSSASAIRDYLKQQGVDPSTVSGIDEAVAFHKRYPGAKIDAYEDRVVPNSPLSRIAASPLATGITQSANALTGGLLDEGAGALDSLVTGRPLGESIAAADRAKQAQAAANPGSALLGNLAGGSLAMLASGGIANAAGLAGRIAPIAGDALYGAAYGAGEGNNNRILGAGVGAAGGVAGNYLGGAATRMFGRAIRGVQNADVRALRAAGVPLTAGQALGGVAKGIEDRLSGLPVIGDVVRNRRLDGFRGFNRAAFDQGLAPISATTGGVTEEAGIDLARAARSQAYRNALDPVSLNPDDQFIGDIQQAARSVNDLPADMATRGEYALRRSTENIDANDQLSGQGLQQAIRRLRRTSSENAPLPNGFDLGEAMGQAENAYAGLVARQSPQTLPALNAANAANRNVEVLRDAVNRARNGTRVGETGLFAPSQLSDAAAANARKFGNSQGTTNQPFFELSRAGQAVLPSSVPDSGTAGRLATLALPAALGVGGGAGYAAGGEEGAASTLGLGALLAAGGTRTGQRTLTNLFLRRPDLLERLGTGVVDNARFGGMFAARLGAPLALTALPR